MTARSTTVFVVFHATYTNGDNMIFTRRFATEGQTREFTIEHAESGWVAREQHDRATRTSVIRDWRHVEATMALFELKASALRSEGWLEISTGA